MFIFLRRSTADSNLDTPIYPISLVSPPNSEDTFRITGKHMPKNITSLFTPPSEGLSIGEEKTEKLRQNGLERMCQPVTYSPFLLYHDSKAAKPMPPSSLHCEKDEIKP